MSGFRFLIQFLRVPALAGLSAPFPASLGSFPAGFGNRNPTAGANCFLPARKATSTADEAAQFASAAKAKRRTPKFYGVRLADLLTAGPVAVGDILVPMQGLYPATAEIGEGGTVVPEGVSYQTPSAAGTKVRGKETNGWDFWAVKGPTASHRLSAIRKRYQDSLPPGGPPLVQLFLPGRGGPTGAV